MAVSAQQVKELRERTGAGMMECKSALSEVDGDMEKAIDLLRKRGLAKADKKAGRTAAEGIVVAALSDDRRRGVLLEVNCETDFVAKNEGFVAFARRAADLALGGAGEGVEALMAAPFDGATVEDARRALVAKLGENINVRRLRRVVRSDKGVVGAYVHAGRIGVLVEVAGVGPEAEGFARDIAMHVAASRPEYLNPDDVPAERLAKEKEVLTAQAASSGKPAAIIEKMISGRLNKLVNEISLLGQAFVKDPDKTVAQVQASVPGAAIVSFVRLEVGEGIEKEQGPDFASEVMAQVRGS